MISTNTGLKLLLNEEQQEELVSMYLDMMNAEAQPETNELFLKEYSTLLAKNCALADNFDMLVEFVTDLIETKGFIIQERNFELADRTITTKFPTLTRLPVGFKTFPTTLEHVLLKLFDFDTAIASLIAAVDCKDEDHFIENALKHAFGLGD